MKNIQNIKKEYTQSKKFLEITEEIIFATLKELKNNKKPGEMKEEKFSFTITRY